MADKTLSEQIFEQLCNMREVQFEPIPRVTDLRTPDYRILLDSTQQAIVEVKQLDLRQEDLRLIDNIQKGKEIFPGFRATGHIRIRNIITNSHSQLQGFAKGLYPAIIVVYDNTTGFAHLDYEDILNAMYGNETIIVDFTQTSEIEANPRGHLFGGKRKLTPDHNTVISAIALLTLRTADSPSLTMFHNIYAELPLNPRIAWQIADKQYTLQRDIPNYQYWSEITR